MKPLTLTELARADGMVWIRCDAPQAWGEHEWYRLGMPGPFFHVQPGTSFLTIPEPDEPRLREIERRVNEVPNA